MQKIIQNTKNIDSEHFNAKELQFSFNLKEANYQLDRLQNKFLEFYIRADPKFRRAFNNNYTSDFLGFIRDKAELKEPIHLSVMGTTRSGKSYVTISFCVYHQACYGKKFTIDYICGNAMEFLDKLKEFPSEKLFNRIFLIDEEKSAVFNVGSTAKKLKLQDVQNIIAINNISTISLNPIKFANTDAFYGLRMFGKCKKTGTNRMMLYNLQESAKLIPVGNIYMPIFTRFLPKYYAEPLEKQYLDKKLEWVAKERRGEGDTLAYIRKKSAEHFIKDKQYLGLKTHDEKVTYISQKLGSEFTRGEVEEIFQITKLLNKGVNLDKDEN